MNYIDIGDGARLFENGDQSFEIIEANGKSSGVIISCSKLAAKPFQVRDWLSTQEVLDDKGKVIARTTDPEMANHICRLLIAYEKVRARKKSSAS